MKSFHGANLLEIQEEYGFNIDEIKDSSPNVNSLGLSPKTVTKLEKNLDKVGVYLDPNYDRPLSFVEKHTNVSRDKILLTSGSTNLIPSFIFLINPKNAIVFNPSYSEYERELNKINSNITSYDLGKSNDFAIDCEKLTRMIKENDVGLVILANPNSPTGYAVENEKLKNLTKSSDCYFMIDETYVEFSYVDKHPAVNLTKKCDNLLVICPTSRFFVAVGIKLGYGIIGNRKPYDDMNKHANLWNINILADILSGKMFTSTNYHKKVFEFINREREEMISTLKRIDCLKAYPSKSNLVLYEILDKKMTAHDLRERLIPYAFIIRDCASFNNLNEYFSRSCILDEQSNDKLLKLTENILKQSQSNRD